MTVDINQLPAPEIIVEQTHAAILAAMLADLDAKMVSVDPTWPGLLPSDPAYKVLEAAAYRETTLRAEFNDRIKALLLAYSWGANLDHIGVTYFDTARLVIDAGDPNAVPPVPPTYEADDDYRARMQLAQEGFSTAGPDLAYVYHAKSAAGDVKDVKVASPTFERLVLTPEQQAVLPAGAQVYLVIDDADLADPTPASVVLSVLSRTGNGTPSAEILAAVETALSAGVRPLTDEVIVRAPAVIDYTVNATLTVYPGLNHAYVREVAEQSLLAWVASQHLIGRDITEDGVRAALRVAGVHTVTLNNTIGTDLVANLAITDTQVAYCTGVTVTVGGEGG